MRQHESLRLRRERDLGSLFGGRVPGVAGALALFLAERCFVYQQVRLLCGIHRGGAGPRVAGERDEPAGPGSAYDVGRSDGLTVGQLNVLTFREFAPERSFGNAECTGFLDVKPPASHVLLHEVAQRGTAAVFSRKRADVVSVPFHRAGHDVSRLYFHDLDGKRHALDAELHRRGQNFLGALRAVKKQRLGTALQAERADQPDHSEEVIGGKVREEDLGEGEAHAVAHHLALGPLTAFE